MSHATRAKGKVRRFVRANRLRFLWTLTYATEPPNRKAVIRHLRSFFAAMRRWRKGLPLIVVIEEGTQTGRLHVHFAADRFLSIEAIRGLWGHGIVHVGDPRKLPGRVPSRRLAAYLAKYVSKALDEVAKEGAKQRAKGEHRYLVTQGHSPSGVTLRYRFPEHALERLTGLYGQPDFLYPFGVWGSAEPYGWFFSFPDHALHPPPGTLRAG